MTRHLVLTGALCAVLAHLIPTCRETLSPSPDSYAVYRMNNAAFAGELCMWTLHGRVCAHEIACLASEYAKGRSL